MQVGPLNKINSLISGNQELIEIYRSMYYLLPVKEKNLSGKILCLLDKREELELELKKCAFFMRNSVDDKKCGRGMILRLMPLLLKLEQLARLHFKGTCKNLIYQGEKKYLKKYFELLYKENLSDSVFKLLLKYKRKQKLSYQKPPL